MATDEERAERETSVEQRARGLYSWDARIRVLTALDDAEKCIRELRAEVEHLNAALAGRDKLLRRAFEAGDNAMVVIAADESWDRWAR